MKQVLLLLAILLQASLLQAQVNTDSPAVLSNGLTPQDSLHEQMDNYRHSENLPGDRYFSISTDIMQYAMVQPNIGLEFRYKRFAYGINFGIVYPNIAFNVNPLANGQYTWPGLVYRGEALRMYCRFFYNGDKPHNYLCAQVEAKYLWYNNVAFMDQVYPDPVTDNYYSMNEKAVALGFDIIHGHEFEAFNFLHVDLFYGLGLHEKIREYTVLNSTTRSEYNANLGYPYPGSILVGNYKSSLVYPVLVLGAKLGINLYRKKDRVN